MAHLMIFFRFPRLQCGRGLGRGQHSGTMKRTLAKAQRAPSKRSELVSQRRGAR
jgi:hypothetical protein